VVLLAEVTMRECAVLPAYWAGAILDWNYALSCHVGDAERRMLCLSN